MPLDNPPDYRSLIENEKHFRSLNESVQKGIDELNRIAREESIGGDIDESKTELFFFCECSDRECRERIRLTLGTYNEIHKDRKCFVLKSGHETDSIEQIVDEVNGYCIVKKNSA